MRLFLLVLSLAAGLVGAVATAEIYRWTDESGTEHFTTDLGKVPPRFRSDALEGAARPPDDDPIQRFESQTPPASARSSVVRRRSPSVSPRRTYKVPVEPAGNSMRVRVRINDRHSAWFLIDTGASHVVIPRLVADRMGIQADPGGRTNVYGTANGQVESPVIFLDSVSLGGARVENVQATILDTLSTGLLGLSFFNHFEYRIDPAAGFVHLTPNGLEQTGRIRGGKSQGQWRSSFASTRARIAQVDAELDRTPSSRSRKIQGLEALREDLERQLRLLDAEADRARVPHGWRR